MSKRIRIAESTVLWLTGIWASMLGLRFAVSSIFSGLVYVPNHVDLFIDWLPLCAIGFLSLSLALHRLVVWAGWKK